VTSIPYYHVDAFTSALFAGNPAGVCILSEFPPERTMLQIAAENRHSQTAFVVQRGRGDGGDADFDLRWFSPVIEDDLCGHATLATAHVLALRGHKSWPVRFQTKSGELRAARSGDWIELNFPARPAAPCDVPTTLLPALGLRDAQVLKDTRDYLVVVESAAQVAALKPDIAALGRLTSGTGGTIVTASGDGVGGGGDFDYVVRFFAPAVGIPEDPATGSITCTLAPYWAARLGKRTLRARQLSPRGGELRCELAGERVKIAGQARLYLQGTIAI
jgi:PhzF family phenazine biosynthesis protein